MYLDSAYIAKYYVNEPDSALIRKLIREASNVCSSSLALVEVSSVVHRHIREGAITTSQGHEMTDLFRSHVEAGFWNFVSITDSLLRKTATMFRGMPPTVPLRAGDAIHLAAALEVEEREIWTSDRHLLAAAQYVGLVGKSVKR